MPYKWEKKYSFDYRLGYIHNSGELPGIKILGNKDAEDCSEIFILGGYTLQDEFDQRDSWPDKLFQLFKNAGISVRLLVGDTDGYVSFQELLLLIRDILLIKPAVVINLSGYNNLRNASGFGMDADTAETLEHYPFVGERQLRIAKDVESVAFGLNGGNIYLGMSEDRSPAEYWVQHMDLMHKICRDFEIAFTAFLQPCMFSGRHQCDATEQAALDLFCYGSPQESLSEVRKVFSRGYKEASGLVCDREHIVDLSGLFDNKSGVYDDPCHLNESGRQMLAEAVFKAVSSLISKTKGEEPV